MPHYFLHQSVDIQHPTLKLFQDTPIYGVDNLDPNLTINGTTVVPMFRYKGGDASAGGWPAWGYGETLSLSVGRGAPEYNQGSPLLGPNDDSVKFNRGAVFRASNTTFADLTTEDFVFEAVIQASDSVSSSYWNGICCKRANTGSYQEGYHLGQYSGGRAGFYISSPSVSASASVYAPTPYPTSYSWHHILVFCNRDENSTNGFMMYVNALPGTGVNAYAARGSLYVNRHLIIGASGSIPDGTPSGVYDRRISYLAMWKQAAWHQAGAAGPTEWAAIAKERFYKMAGFWPTKSEGTALPTFVRGSVATIDKIENGTRKMYMVSAGWPRLVSRNDENGNNIKGYLCEHGMLNYCNNSEDFIFSGQCRNKTESRNNIIIDGYMEDPGVTAWTKPVTTTLTKETDTPHSGSQYLRVTRTTANNPYAAQMILNTGKEYRINGWARGNGTAYPQVNALSTSWVGTTSTTWQEFNLALPATQAYIYLYAITSAGTNYADFDDIVVYPFDTPDHFDNKVTDSNMENVGTADWVAGNNAVITKQTTNPYKGSQVLRVARNGTNIPNAGQEIVVDGYEYRVTGLMRSDGYAKPTVWLGGQLMVTGTVSMAWQYINVIGPYLSDGYLKLASDATVDGQYVEFDDIQASLMYNAPNKEKTAMAFVADSTNTEHGITRFISKCGGVSSIFAKRGDKNWLYMYVRSSHASVFDAWCYFDLLNGVVGSSDPNAPYCYMEDWGDGWFRCVIAPRSFCGGVDSSRFLIQPCESNGNRFFAGDGVTVNMYLWGLQSEHLYQPNLERTSFATSYCPAVTGVYTRIFDSLYYKGDDGNIGTNSEGTLSSNFLFPDCDLNQIANLITASDDGDMTVAVNCKIDQEDDGFRFYNSIDDTEDVCNGIIQKQARGAWSASNIWSYINGRLIGKI